MQLGIFMSMSATEHIAVALPADILAAVRMEAGGNVSAYTAKALRGQAVRDAADRLAAWQRSRTPEFDDLQELALDSLDAAVGGER
ncbi:hypothetical protein GCM10010388_00570 [Streptomyces mauvecolor]